MFTGIIEGTGSLKGIKKRKDSMEVQIAADFDLGPTSLGESVSVNGCCLTVTSKLGNTFWADVSSETIIKTTFSHLKEKQTVNLERPLKIGDRVGGHIVQGHVDGVGRVHAINVVDEAHEFQIIHPAPLTKYIVPKGSIAVDGVSLTVNYCDENLFTITIIAHTQLKTTFSDLNPGDLVNIEVDVLGKYLERMEFLHSDQFHETQRSKMTKEFLKKFGF